MPPHFRGLKRIAYLIKNSVNPRHLIEWTHPVQRQGRNSPSARRSRRNQRRVAAAIENLPLELLWMIFEDLGTKGLSSCSKTSRALRWAAEPILYKKICVTEKKRPGLDAHQISPEKAGLLLKTLQCCPKLGSIVRNFSSVISSLQADEEVSEHIALLSLTPNLRRLEIRWAISDVLELLGSFEGRKFSILSYWSRDKPLIVFPHKFELLTDLTIGPVRHEVQHNREDVEHLVPLLRLPSLKTLALHSLGVIWANREDLQLPHVSSGIQHLKLIDTTMSKFPIETEVCGYTYTDGGGPYRKKVSPVFASFLACIKDLKELTLLYNPYVIPRRDFEFSEVTSDLQCHASNLKRLTIDAKFRHQRPIQGQHIGSFKDFTRLTSLAIPYAALIEEAFLPAVHEFDNEDDAIDRIPTLLPPQLRELIICPSGRYLEPAVRLAVWMEEKRRHEDCFQTREKLWIGFRSKRYEDLARNVQPGEWDGGRSGTRFEDEDYLERIAPMPYGDDSSFCFQSWDATMALRDLPGTSFRSYMGHYMKKYHDHMRNVQYMGVDWV